VVSVGIGLQSLFPRNRGPAREEIQKIGNDNPVNIIDDIANFRELESALAKMNRIIDELCPRRCTGFPIFER